MLLVAKDIPIKYINFVFQSTLCYDREKEGEKMKKIVILLMLLIGIVLGQEEGFPLTDFEKARAGDEEATLLAIEKIKKLKSSDINNAYIGSLITMKARYTYLPWKKLEYVENGSKLLDAAVKNNPEDVAIRLNRFFTFINLPAILKKESIVQLDVKSLMKLYKEKKVEKSYEDELFKAFVMFFHKYDYPKEKDKYLKKIKSQKSKEYLNKWFANL